MFYLGIHKILIKEIPFFQKIAFLVPTQMRGNQKTAITCVRKFLLHFIKPVCFVAQPTLAHSIKEDDYSINVTSDW